MTRDDKTDPLLRTAARVVIAAGVAILGTGGYFAWRHFAYQAAVKPCTMGLPAETLMRLDARDARLEGTAEGPITRCFRDAGF